MEELLSEIMKLYVHAIGKKLDEDIMADEIKLNKATADKIVEWLQDNCKRYDEQGYYVIRAKYIARYINSLVVEDEPIQDFYPPQKPAEETFVVDTSEPSYKKRDREYWKDVDEPDLITDAIEKEFASSKNDIEYFTNFMVGVDNNNNLVYETAEDIAGRMFEKYKNEFYKTRKTNLYFVPWLEQE